MTPDVFVHMSYLLLVGASLLRAIMPLRILAIGSGLCAAVYDFSIQEYAMLAWESAFVLINAGQVGLLLYERQRVKLTNEEVTLHKRMFSQLSLVDFHRLIRMGTFVSAAEGEVLTRQSHPVARIVLITEGALSVDIDGKTVAYCREGDFVGEMAFVSGKPASATVTTIAPSRYLMWRFNDLKTLLEKHPEIRTALQSVFNSNLIDKLARESPEEEVV